MGHDRVAGNPPASRILARPSITLITVHMGQTTTLEPPKPETPAATTDQGMPANPQDAPQSMRAHPDAPQHDGASQGI
ncbi:hypothetical protein CAL18_03760 [Bordetella genomosp. 7]|uniref:hypothetical protein n=1 Tax=Bordetella TaxID=517 RepID=UPI000576888A|nr:MULTISPECIES: hypothetical protein [Bordetella]OZI27730.1 hypothetical protein CAL18_03760 [Bordetella genomosp. 7]